MHYVCCTINFFNVVLATLCAGLIFVVLFFCITACSLVLFYQCVFVLWVGTHSVFVLLNPACTYILSVIVCYKAKLFTLDIDKNIFNYEVNNTLRELLDLGYGSSVR